jgi:2-polyprenyl-3-methyl-5-hydroxy-6-metoxy-1,4-benzoquinol methylase
MSDNSYWNNFYNTEGKKEQLSNPSQFAVFVAGEMVQTDNIIEFGSGNGRDAFYFAALGKNVHATDASQSAVENNNALAAKKNCNNILFSEYTIGSKKEFEVQSTHQASNKSIYSRFFLHSLTDELISEFIELCSSMLKTNEKLFVEYRTNKDERRNKEYLNHYRNYINPDLISSLCQKNDFTIDYHVEGLGYAKYKNDDAYVARTILNKN